MKSTPISKLFLNWRFGRNSIETRLTILLMLVIGPLLMGISVYISSRAGAEIETRSKDILLETNSTIATNLATWLELHQRTVKEMALLPEIISMDPEQQKPILQAIASAHPNLFLVQTTDLQGINVARSDDSEPKDYHDRQWFLGPKSGAPFTSQLVISRTNSKPALNLSTPIVNKQGQIVGVADIVSQLDEVSREVVDIKHSSGISYIVDDTNHVVAHPDPTFTDKELKDLSDYAPVKSFREAGQTGFINFNDENGVQWVAYVSSLKNGWIVITQQHKSELLAPVRKFQLQSTVLLMLGALVLFVLVWFAIRRTLQPIGVLTATASAIAAGDFSRQAEVKSQDEIGALASTFNNMTAKLRQSLATLESSVAERTHSLELAAEVARSVSQVRALDAMLKDAAELIRSRFDLYYVQVYLTNQSQNAIVLQAGTGHVGIELMERGHRLPINTASINGRAVVEKRSVIISDTTRSTTFRPNPLLPETKSEMAIPLIANDMVVGVLDLQSEKPAALSQDLLSAFEALAGQLAIAIQNAKLLANAEQARAEMEKQAARLIRTNWEEYLDATHKPEYTGFVLEGNKVMPLSEAEEIQPLDVDKTISAPITLAGEQLGSLVVETDERNESVQTAELINVVARQVAQQIENLRLLESAERYRTEAEQAARRFTFEGWQEYIGSRNASNMSYLYDLTEVRPVNEEHAINESVVTLPLKVREETIGKLAVNGLTSDDKNSVELINAVAERLGAHIDGLRQHEQTQSALAQSQKLFEASRSLTQATNLQELVAASVKTLDISEVNRALLASFEYDAAGEIKALTIIGNWWSGAGMQVTPVGTPYSLDVIRAMPMFVSPTPVFFNDTSIDERIDATTMKLVQRLNLRAVAVLPLHLGSRQLGALILEAEQPHNFTSDETRLFASLAPQIATVVENRQQYEKARHQAEREAMLNTINQKIQSATTVDAVLQIAARELGSALGAPLTIAQLGLKNRANGN